MYLTLAVLLPDQQTVNDGHCDVELLEDFGLFFDLAGLDEFVQAFLGQYQSHEILFDGVLVSDIMDVLHVPGIQPYETEVILLHARNVPLQRFQYDIIAGRDVHRAAQTLLCTDEYAVYRIVEASHDILSLLEGDVSLNDKYRTFRKMLAYIAFV